RSGDVRQDLEQCGSIQSRTRLADYMDGVHSPQPGHRSRSQADRDFDRRGTVSDGSGGRKPRSAGAPGNDGRTEATSGMRRAAGARPSEARAARLLQWLEPRATGGEIRGAGEHGENLAAPQHDGHPGMSRTGMSLDVHALEVEILWFG